VYRAITPLSKSPCDNTYCNKNGKPGHVPALYKSMLKAGTSVLVTGSCGLIGSEVCSYFAKLGYAIVGIDNNSRAVFFGPEGDTRWSLQRLKNEIPGYRHEDISILDREAIRSLIAAIRPGLLVHTAAQPSHDRAAAIPFQDFEVNAVGTLNLLQAVRETSPETVFVHMSTNKVYGDGPNAIRIKELDARWDYDDPRYEFGIAEDFSVDQSMHSLFGVSKLAGDVLVQEYGRYFGIPTCCLRSGCLTGPNHSGVELHGFLSYLVKCNLEERVYKVYGYKGKQVRDNIHAFDVAAFIHRFAAAPRIAEVYNLGGGKENSCSILEAFEATGRITGKKMRYEYFDQHRRGDHICYYSDLRKMQEHYPGWNLTRPLDLIIKEIAEGWISRTSAKCVS
jgi:CDP-paratose 2-epimerase